MLDTAIMKLMAGPVKDMVDKRQREFSDMQKKKDPAWFSELCFCILTANSKAKTAIQIQEELGFNGFCTLSRPDLAACIRKHGHRFHNNKSGFITGARKHKDIKRKVHAQVREGGQLQAREWLVANIKGIGYKEASHFLRNVGFTELAILDRHILNILHSEGIIESRPKTLSKKTYLDIESRMEKVADRHSLCQSELDMYMWYMKTGEILK